MTAERPCRDCGMRCVGCHGKDRDGAWRCRKWGEYQDELEEEQRRTSRERLESMVSNNYIRESILRFTKRKKRKH